MPVVVKGLGARGEIGASTERSAASCEDHGPDIVVRINGIDGGEEVPDHHRRARVELVGPVQRDGGDVVDDVVLDLGEVHAGGRYVARMSVAVRIETRGAGDG